MKTLTKGVMYMIFESKYRRKALNTLYQSEPKTLKTKEFKKKTTNRSLKAVIYDIIKYKFITANR